MNKKYLKRTLSTIIASTCGIITIPLVATNISSSQNASTMVQEQKNSFVNNEDANNNENFKITSELVGTYNEGVLVTGSHKNNFPMGIHPNGYHDVEQWQKSYDGGKTFINTNIDGYYYDTGYYLFDREDIEFQVRKIVNWYWYSYESGSLVLAFTTNSKPITVNKKLSANVINIKETKEKVDFKINLKGINNFNEQIKFTLSKEVNGRKSVVDSTNNQFKKINEASNKFKNNNGFYYELEAQKEIDGSRYTFEYEIITSDTTKRKHSFSFLAGNLNKSFTVNQPVTLSETDETLNIKIDFEKYDLINDYVVSFIEVDSNGSPIQNGYIPFAKKISDFEYQLLKIDSEKTYKVKISSKSLGSEIISEGTFKVGKKVVSQPNPKPPVTEPEKPAEPKPPVTEPENPSLPDNDNITGSNQNNSNNKSSIAIISTLTIIALIAVACSIIFFINMKKNNKK